MVPGGEKHTEGPLAKSFKVVLSYHTVTAKYYKLPR